MDNPDKIEEIISKFLAGEATPEEAILLEDWKLSAPENLQQFNQSEKLFFLLKNRPHSLNMNKTVAWKKVEAETIHKVKIIPIYKNNKFILVIAASLLMLVCSYFLIQKQSAAPTSYTVAADAGQKNISLADQTSIQIKQGSSIVYDKNFGETNRNVKLYGSAYFTVKHSEILPFIVDLGHVYVKDLGTKFNITLSADTDSIYIKVDEGIVLLFDSSSNAIEIKASEHAIYIKSTKQMIQPTALNSNATQLNYDKSPLSLVIAELEEKFVVKIMLENPNLKNCLISAKFKDEDLATILAVITETLGLTLVKQNELFLIKGQACN